MMAKVKFEVLIGRKELFVSGCGVSSEVRVGTPAKGRNRGKVRVKRFGSLVHWRRGRESFHQELLEQQQGRLQQISGIRL